MSTPFIQLWSKPQIEIEKRTVRGDGDLIHTAGNQFSRVKTGDRVYLVATTPGDLQLLLIGSVTVEKIMGQAEAEAHLGCELYVADVHLIGTGTPMSLHRKVPERIARNVQRESGPYLGVDADRYRVNVFGLRSVGAITGDTASRFDKLLNG